MIQNSEKILRCPWAGIEDPEYARYHDKEWGIPQNDSLFLFEKLILESFQAGLSWLIILKKRVAFRQAFDNFNPELIAAYDRTDIDRLMRNTNIVRNYSKIEAAIKNARAYIKLSERSSFAGILWAPFTDGPIINSRNSLKDIPTTSKHSHALSKNLKQMGFKFVGPTTMYAFMQSVGMVNDHLISCPRHVICAKLQKKFILPPSDN